MHYVIGDIHNELNKLKSVLGQINLTSKDELIVLGDVFDRGGYEANPVGVYFALTAIQGKCTWIRGNHDQWLANYIYDYYQTKERKRDKLAPYHYNSFELMKERLTEVDMLDIADLIARLPIQKEYEINGNKYLFAHAMTSHPGIPQSLGYYLMGTAELDPFFLYGTEGFISFVGHTPSANVIWKHGKGKYLDEDKSSIWTNNSENVYLMDCGCGFGSGKLACMCIETGERFYSR